MTITSKPLWKLLIDRDMTREDLRHATGLSPATIAKLGRDGNVTTDVLARICTALECDINDICEVVPNEQEIAQ
ncbi:helix-turn-helix transcriptional regulator [Arcanobacterium hippocoleae]|uniref:DNA-binding Xre family transcriptional regulator n=1 Tax=Arcanobacterium hippocoleae TaxID=149017 RepID=A0ABU1SZQ2_9ACTO|nr:helix-turn-helix transcriptional regulator [Arcanobacterium hippocoleae]MDR6938524.1 DNA-binding Xre family transcriptional regulator [Arcanobacterium hippocoleae]